MSATGVMKTIKIAAERMHSLAAYFFVFPGCQDIRLAVEHRLPVGGGATPDLQCFNPLPLRGLCVLQAAAVDCMFYASTTSATGSRGDAPGGVQG